MEGFVTAREVAERLGVAPDTVTRWCREGRIPAVRPGRDWRIPASVIEDLLDGVPSRHWSADLTRRLAGLRPPAHVLALVPGRDHDARRFVETLAALGLPVRAGAQPPGAASGGIVARAVLLAAARAAVAADEEALAEDEARTGGGPPILVRRVPAQAGLALSAERRIAGAVERRGRVAVCVLPLSRGPDPRPLLPHHSHLLLGAVHGRSWLSATEPAAAAGA